MMLRPSATRQTKRDRAGAKRKRGGAAPVAKAGLSPRMRGGGVRGGIAAAEGGSRLAPDAPPAAVLRLVGIRGTPRRTPQ